MKHLNAEEIISYVTLDRMDEDTRMFFKNVNGHIRACPECLGKLRRYLDIHDIFQEQNPGCDFKIYAAERMSEEFSLNFNELE